MKPTKLDITTVAPTIFRTDKHWEACTASQYKMAESRMLSDERTACKSPVDVDPRSLSKRIHENECPAVDSMSTTAGVKSETGSTNGSKKGISFIVKNT